MRSSSTRVARPAAESSVYDEWQRAGRISPDGFISDPNAKLTPTEEKQVKRVERLDGPQAAEAKRQEYLKSKRAPYTRSPEFRNEVNRRMGQGGGQAAGARPGAKPSPQRMNAHEKEYQSLYNRLSPEDRKALEDAFQREYGRAPRRPQ